MNQEIQTQAREVMSMINQGVNPTTQQVEMVIPYLKVAEKQIEKFKEHVKQRAKNGEEFEGVSVSKPSVSVKVCSTIGVYKTLKDNLGDKFDAKSWSSFLSISEAKVHEFYCQCLDLNPRSKDGKDVREEMRALISMDTETSKKESTVRIGV